MRPTSTLLVLITSAALATAADPKPEDSSRKYLEALQKTAELLAKVKDEATAAEAKPKLENFHEEARDARKKMFKAMAELDIPDSTLTHFFEQFPKIVRQADSAITAEFDRIGNNHKAAYKVLREAKVFAELEKEYEEKAWMGANNLLTAARVFTTRNPDKPLTLQDLAPYLDTGKKGLTDPWGYSYQITSVGGKLHLWTVNPYTGKKLGTPRQKRRTRRRTSDPLASALPTITPRLPVRRFLTLFALLVVGCSPAFQIVSDRKADAAAVKAVQLQTIAKHHATRNEDAKLESLDVLAQYAEEGEEALIDPWGQRFQFKYVSDPETQTERLVIWTAVPETGQVIAAPRQLAHLVEPPN